MEDQNRKTKSSNVINLKTGERQIDFNIKAKLGSFKPNEELIQSTARIKKQRDVIQERIDKMVTANERVSKNVFEKVKRDYSLQLQTITELLNEKKAELKKEIKELYLFREKLTIEVNRHKEILEEAEFRLFLGEFSQNQYQEVENFETKEIEKLETELTQISGYIQTHEDLFDPEDLGLPPRTVSTEKTKTIAKEPEQKKQETILTDNAINPDEVTQQLNTQPEPEPELEPKAEEPTPALQTQNTENLSTQEPVTEQINKSDITTEPLAEQKQIIAPEPELKTNVEPQTEPEQPKEDPEEINIDPSEFEDLFLDDDDNQNQPAQETKQEEPKKEKTDEQNYFEQEKVNESSFTVKTEDLKDVIDQANLESDDEITAQKATMPEEPVETKTDVVAPKESEVTAPSKEIPDTPKTENELETPSQTPGVVEDDSISDILNSLPSDDLPQTNEESLPLETAAQDSTSPFYLKLIDGEHEQKEFPLKENISIGRSPSSDIVLKAPKVSRQHAAINMYNNQYIIIDLKSSNGVYVNGTKIDECVLNPGDEISVGGYRFTFTNN